MNDERRTTNDGKILAFTDLKAWQESHKLAVSIYRDTRKFPKEEMYGLTSQIRRAGVSVTSNIAEGFSRDTYPDKAHFYVMAHASISEVISQLLIARDVGYMDALTFKELENQANIAFKLLRGLIRSTKEKK